MTRTKLKDIIDYWKGKREDYIQKVKDDYKPKEDQTIVKDFYNCPICSGEHEIDKYDFVDSCIGYYAKDNMNYHIIEWEKEHGKKKSKS